MFLPQPCEDTELLNALSLWNHISKKRWSLFELYIIRNFLVCMNLAIHIPKKDILWLFIIKTNLYNLCMLVHYVIIFTKCDEVKSYVSFLCSFYI